MYRRIISEILLHGRFSVSTKAHCKIIENKITFFGSCNPQTVQEVEDLNKLIKAINEKS